MTSPSPSRSRLLLAWLLVSVIAGVLFFTLAGLALYLLGRQLPPTHTASASVELPVSAERAFALIADVDGMKQWPGSGIDAVEPLPPENALPVVRQRMGRNSFVLRTTEYAPPTRLTRTIADDHEFFSGSWTYEIAPTATGSRVTLTETGRVDAALPRAVMRYISGEDTTLKKHLESLKAVAK